MMAFINFLERRHVALSGGCGQFEVRRLGEISYAAFKRKFNVVSLHSLFAMKDRTINGQPAVGSFFAEKGGIYEFKMTLLGKEPGKWHVHPGIAISGTGTLVGPGDWVTVKNVGKFEFPVTLLNGQTVELGTYGGQFVWWWSFVGFLLGMAWMVYWTFTKRTVTNLAVTMQLPVNDDAPDIGLITPRDHMWMNIIAGLTVLLLIIGWTYAATSYPVRWPQQTDWIRPAHISSGPVMAEVRPAGWLRRDGRPGFAATGARGRPAAGGAGR